MKLIKATALAAGIALSVMVPSFCQAQGVLGGPDSSWYAGGSVGQSSNGICSLPFGTGRCDDSGTAYRIFAGYQVNRYLALELGYHQLNDATLSSIGVTQTFETEVFDLTALGILPVSEKFGLYGRLGLFRANMDGTSNFPGATNLSLESTGLTYGVGLQYDVTRNLAVRAEWQQFANVTGGVLLSSLNIDLTSIAAIWRFK